MAVTGVRMDEIGDMYDFALGYTDPNSGNTLMVGYVLPENVRFSEATNLQDEEHIVQIASPNQVDRFERYPKVSQGDWTGGRGQKFFVNANQFYSSGSGLDFSQPGQMSAFGLQSVYTKDNASTRHRLSIASDGAYEYIGCLNGTNNMLFTSTTDPIRFGGFDFATFATNSEVVDLLHTPAGVIAQTLNGLWQLKYTGLSFTSTQLSNDAGTINTFKSIAYFNDTIYYITADNKINYITTLAGGATPGTTFLTAGAMEGVFTCLASTSAGLFFVKTSTSTNDPAQSLSYLYVSDGTIGGTQRVGDINGQVYYAHEINGVTYILANLNAIGGANPGGYTLFALSGSTLSIVDDTRWLPQDLQPGSGGGAGPGGVGSLSGDGRYLYVAWPSGCTADGGNAVNTTQTACIFRYDLLNNMAPATVYVQNTVVASGSGGPAGGIAGVAAAPGGIVLVQDTAGSTKGIVGVTMAQYATSPLLGGPTTNGPLTTSFFDFGAPTTNKVFRSIEFDLTQPISSSGGSISVSYVIDDNTVYTSLALQQGNSPNSLIGYFPANTKGFRVRFKITLNWVNNANLQSVGPAPVSYAVKANLGRVWQLSAACRRDQRSRVGEKDSQNLSAASRIANIVQAYRLTAGQCVLYIPDPTQPAVYSNGVLTNPEGVTQVNALIQDYGWSPPNGVSPAMRDTQVDGGVQRDMEGDVSIVLVEQL